jgi:hypothetical protein
LIYGISKVAYSNDGSEITHVLLHEIKNNTVLNPSQVPKEDVVIFIEANNACWTILENADKWVWGAQVHVVKTIHGKYLRTDKNNVPEDNLGNLPTFTPKVASYSY